MNWILVGSTHSKHFWITWLPLASLTHLMADKWAKTHEKDEHGTTLSVACWRQPKYQRV